MKLKLNLINLGTLAPGMITAANVPETELLIIADMVCTQVQLAETIFGSILHGSFNEAFAQVFASMGFFNIQGYQPGVQIHP